MENQVEVMTYAQLKEIMQVLEANEAITEDTKVFIDTGWDSVQEVAPDAVSIEKVAKIIVADVLTNESFAGYSLEEKAEKMNAEGDLETAIIIRNLY
ncbi:hypothetical protein QSV48_07040 [Enterococcus faecalis]|uniref:hypothetical protein n=1 Tax=Enterococcus faecalis TaxID=1351 RepID=UPI00259B32F5|nr:hypothetical protein [Enterococcus faecalis]MDM4150660.1 hypothetical protein [Enterococcus faecalis]